MKKGLIAASMVVALVVAAGVYNLYRGMRVKSAQLLAAEFPVKVEDSGAPEVDALVVRLVSARPAPYPSGSSQMFAQADMGAPHITAEVGTAITKLTAMGPTIFPALVKHLRDDRYSYSDISAAWINFTVGDAVTDVFSDGYDMVPGYKFRETPKGLAFYLSFRAYLDEREPNKWAAWAKSKSRLDIRLDFIDWCVSKEKERGFTSEAQREGVLARYAEAREKAKKAYSEPNHAAAGTQPVNSFLGGWPPPLTLPLGHIMRIVIFTAIFALVLSLTTMTSSHGGLAFGTHSFEVYGWPQPWLHLERTYKQAVVRRGDSVTTTLAIDPSGRVETERTVVHRIDWLALAVSGTVAGAITAVLALPVFLWQRGARKEVAHPRR